MLMIEELETVVAPESGAAWAGIAAGVLLAVLVCSS